MNSKYIDKSFTGGRQRTAVIIVTLFTALCIVTVILVSLLKPNQSRIINAERTSMKEVKAEAKDLDGSTSVNEIEAEVNDINESTSVKEIDARIKDTDEWTSIKEKEAEVSDLDDSFIHQRTREEMNNQACGDIPPDIRLSKTVTKRNVVALHDPQRPSFLRVHSVDSEHLSVPFVQRINDPCILEDKHRRINRITNIESRQHQFFESSTFFKVLDMLKDVSCLTIVGASGDGKTAIAENIALRLKNDNFELNFVHDAEFFQRCLNLNVKQLFVINDPFGKQIFDEQSLCSWVKLSKELKYTLNPENTKVVTTIRKPLYQSHDKRIHETMLTENIFDLTRSDQCLSKDDKLDILKRYIPLENLSGELTKILANKIYFPGYPLYCHIIGVKNKRKPHPRIEKDLLNPTLALKECIKELKQTNRFQYCCLVLAVLHNGTFDVNDLAACDRDLRSSDGDTRNIDDQKILRILASCKVNHLEFGCSIELKESFNALAGVYFEKSQSIYAILHDAITGAVAEIYGIENLNIILSYSSSPFLREYVRAEGAADIPEMGVCIEITPKYYECFAERFIYDIKNRDIVDVFLNSSIKHSQFQRELMQTLLKYDQKDLKDLMYTQPPGTNLELGSIVKFTKFALDIAILSATPFHWICKLGLIDIFRAVISKMRDAAEFIDQLPGHTKPLHFASGDGHLSIVKELVKLGVDVNVKSQLKINTSDKIGEFYSGFTPLLYAARQNHPNVVEFLLQHGADPNIVRDHGGSPLLLAADRGHTEVVETLLKHEADPNIHCDHGTTPLILAAQDGHLDTVRVLINGGAELNRQKFESNISALFAAAKMGKLECVRILVENDADIDLPGEDGSTPLLVSLMKKHLAIAKYLANAGANVHAMNKHDEPALKIATHLGINLIENVCTAQR